MPRGFQRDANRRRDRLLDRGLPAVPSVGRARVAAVPAYVAAARRATEALPDRRSASGLCFCGYAPPLGAGRFPAALLDRPFVPPPAAGRVRSGSSWDPPAVGRFQSTQPDRGDPDVLAGYRILVRQDAARRQTPSIGNSGFYEHSTWSMYATSHSRISGTIPAPARCWIRSSDVAQASCFAQAALGFA